MIVHRYSLVGMVAIFAIYIGLSLACASSSGVQTPDPEFNVTYEYESDAPTVTINVKPSWGGDVFDEGILGFACEFTNNSDGIAKVVWEGSSLYYGGNSYVPFIEGQKYVDKNNPMPAATLPPKGYLLKEVYSADQVYYSSGSYGGWLMIPIEDNPVQIIFQIDSKNGSEYVIVNVSYSESENVSQ